MAPAAAIADTQSTQAAALAPETHRPLMNTCCQRACPVVTGHLSRISAARTISISMWGKRRGSPGVPPEPLHTEGNSLWCLVLHAEIATLVRVFAHRFDREGVVKVQTPDPRAAAPQAAEAQASNAMQHERSHATDSLGNETRLVDEQTQLASAWLPADFVHPRRVVFSDDVYLRPIRAEDVDIDLIAVSSNREMLWAQYGEAWDWPPAELSRESDLEDLARHAEEVERHESFNYAILSGDEGSSNQRLLGCVYIDPPEVPHDDGSACEAEVSWWCVSDAPARLAQGLDDFVRSWIAAEWPFTAPCTPFNAARA